MPDPRARAWRTRAGGLEQAGSSVVVRPIACAGSERAAADGVREPEKRPDRAALAAMASVRHRARGNDHGRELA